MCFVIKAGRNIHTYTYPTCFSNSSYSFIWHFITPRLILFCLLLNGWRTTKYWPANYLGNLKCRSLKYGPKLLQKITQAICQLNINSFWQLQIYSELSFSCTFVSFRAAPKCFMDIYEMHTDAHFSYCVCFINFYLLCESNDKIA